MFTYRKYISDIFISSESIFSTPSYGYNKPKFESGIDYTKSIFPLNKGDQKKGDQKKGGQKKGGQKKGGQKKGGQKGREKHDKMADKKRAARKLPKDKKEYLT